MKMLKITIIVLVLALILSVTALGYLISEFYLKKPDAEAVFKSFTVQKGDGVKKISARLKTEGLIDNTFIFEVYVWMLGLEGVFQPGDYAFKPRQSIYSLVKAMTSINIKEQTFTIIEGWNAKTIAGYLKNKGLIKNESEFYYLTGRPAVDYRKTKVDFKGGWDYSFLADKPAYAGLEGYIYPDTYRILEGAGAQKLLEKALNNFDKKLTDDLRAEIKRQGKTIFEVVNLASIVEREISGYENRRMVADVFLKRLKTGMALQSDASIDYITGKGMASPLYSDLEIESPWNTYKHSGLPLGPVSNPSIEAIKAVIYPAPNDYYYFLTDKDGKIYFAKTYAEHLNNKAKYLK